MEVTRMAQIYIAFADTPGLFASLIRLVLKQKYIHVAVSMDPGLEETYSIGRRHPSIPLIAGFEKEDKRKILRAFPEADYMVASIECTEEQKEYIRERLRETMKKRFRYHYTILGLPFLLMNIPFYQKNHYTCSSFAARLLEEAGVCSWGKHFSLVTPKDFMEYDGKRILFEGSLRDLVETDERGYVYGPVPAFSLARPAYAGNPYRPMQAGYMKTGAVYGAVPAAYRNTGMYRGVNYER